MPSMPRWIRTSSAGIQLMSVVACIVDGWSWSKPSARAIAAMRITPVTVTPWRSTACSGDFLQSGRGGQQGGGRAEERADDGERQKELHHGLVDIDHACSRSRGDEDGGDREDDGAGEQRAHIGLQIAGLGASYCGAEPAGQGARAAYVRLDDLPVEEPHEARAGPHRADEERRVHGVQVEADGGVPVQPAEQQPPGVRRVGRVRDVPVGRFVAGDGLRLDLSGVCLRVGGDGAEGTRAACAVVCRQVA